MEKFKAWLKKSWGYIVAFVAGFASMFLLNKRRADRAQSDIEELRNKLLEYSDLVDQTGRANSELAKQLDQSTRKYNELREQLDTAAGDAGKIAEVNKSIGAECQSMGDAIEQLREFIERNATTT